MKTVLYFFSHTYFQYDLQLTVFICFFILLQVYHPLPRGFSLSESQTYIEGLPNNDSPLVFGMDPNAEKAFRESEAKSLMDTVLSVQPRLALSLMG